VDVSEYVMLGAMLSGKDPGQPPKRIIALAPKQSIKVIDTWHVAGLSGTGSKNLEAKDLFVPAHCVVDAECLSDGTSPGLEHNPAAVYRVPVSGLFPHLVTAVALGNAAGAYEEFLDTAAQKRTLYAKLDPKQLVGIQMRVAEAGALIDAGKAVMLGDAQEAMKTAAQGNRASEEQKLRWRRNGTYAAGFGTKAVDLLFAGTGGGGIYLSNPAQRRFRDAHAAISHIQASWDINGADYGRLILSQ
jgi:3-hydroxy-9,10-secoandrosta-1,3,5(10)-triene-9,17-dione monooxygenase